MDVADRQNRLHDLVVVVPGRHGGSGDHLVGWRQHPEAAVTDRFSLSDAGSAHELGDAGHAGKAWITWEDTP